MPPPDPFAETTDTGSAWTSWLRLQQTPGIGLRTQHRLLTEWGSPEAAFQASAAQWSAVLGGPGGARLRDEALRLNLTDLLTKARQWLARPPPQTAHTVLTWDDPRYPAPLLDLPDPPLLLWVAHPHEPRDDTISALQQADDWTALWARCVAMVGSRNPTAQGALTARQLAQALSAQGRCVVSGLALGIDAAAHRGALDTPQSPIATVAVLGTGIDQVYPRQHRELALAIARRGLLMAELPPGTPPLAHHFPQRNRLIAALCPGTLVVEAALASGSLITARMAAGLGREVMAVPGSIHMPTSRGCHALLRDGAALIESADDVLALLPAKADLSPVTPRPDAGTASTPRTRGRAPGDAPRNAPMCAPDPTPAAPADTLAPPEAGHTRLLQSLGTEPVGLDALSQQCGLPAPALQAGLLDLELAGLAARLPGGPWVRLYHLRDAMANDRKPEDSRKHPPD